MSEPVFQDALDLLEALDVAGAKYVVVGAHALAAHGIPRATADFDVLVGTHNDNAHRVILALRDFGAPLAAHGVTAEDLQRPGIVYQLGVPPRRIDILTSIDGVTFDEAVKTCIWVTVRGHRFPVLGRDTLIENKRSTGRAKDLLDVKALMDGADPTSSEN